VLISDISHGYHVDYPPSDVDRASKGCVHRMLVSLFFYTSTSLRVLNSSSIRFRHSATAPCTQLSSLSVVRNLQVLYTLIFSFFIPPFPLFFSPLSLPSSRCLFSVFLSLCLPPLLSFISPSRRRSIYLQTSLFSVYHSPSICTGTDPTPNSMI
jgi:hypothetical protein